MLEFVTTGQFRKDYKRVKKRGYDMSQLEKVLDLLMKEQPLDDCYNANQALDRLKKSDFRCRGRIYAARRPPITTAGTVDARLGMQRAEDLVRHRSGQPHFFWPGCKAEAGRFRGNPDKIGPPEA